ncbi:MAG: hypothetical protein ACRELU_12785 [Gemmatimonadota bacterium]
MHRTLHVVLFLSSTALLSACQGSGDEFPSAPASGEVSSSPEAEQIQELIRAVFPEPGLENATLKRFGMVEIQLGRGLTEDAIEKTFALIDFTVHHHVNDRLEVQPGPLINAWLAYVGLDPIAPDLDDPDAAFVKCVGSEECRVITETRFAGVVFPAGALPGTHYVSIRRLGNDPGPFDDFGFPVGEGSFPLFYKFSITPETAFGPGVVGGVCVVDPPNPFAPPDPVVERLRLAHLVEGESGPEVEILPLANADFLDCTGASTSPALTGLGAWGARTLAAFEPLSDFFVAPLWASPGRLGATIAAFSPFGAVDPEFEEGPGEPVPTTTTLVFQDPTLIAGQVTTATATVTPPPDDSLAPFVNIVFSSLPGGAGTTVVAPLEDGEAVITVKCDPLNTFPDDADVEVRVTVFARAVFPGVEGFLPSASNSFQILACSAPIG